MKVHPIIFSAEMVQALLSGQKTQTRRLESSPLSKVKPGDLLYVRESFRFVSDWDDTKAGDVPFDFQRRPSVYFEADRKNALPAGIGKLRPSIFMPKWCSRLTLLVTDIRFEPLQNISQPAAEAEGVNPYWGQGMPDYVVPFCRLWDRLHDKAGERWDDNPTLVALTFEVLAGNFSEYSVARVAPIVPRQSGGDDE